MNFFNLRTYVRTGPTTSRWIDAFSLFSACFAEIGAFCRFWWVRRSAAIWLRRVQKNQKTVLPICLLDWRVACLTGKSPACSWIGYRLQIGLTLASSSWLSDFKTKTSFGFLVPNYMGYVFWMFWKIKKWACLADFDVFGNCSEDSIVLRWQRHISESAYYERKTNFCL